MSTINEISIYMYASCDIWYVFNCYFHMKFLYSSGLENLVWYIIIVDHSLVAATFVPTSCQK